MKDINTRDLLAETKFYDGYSRWDDTLGRYETWDESVSRVMTMHRTFYKDKMTDELSVLIDEAEDLYRKKYVLGAQRALQFGGEQILKNHMKLYNCTSSYADRPAFFGELFWILLCGSGVGFSVQNHHVDRLPNIAERKKQAKGYIIEDSIEGWASALDVLMSSYFVGGGKHPEYEGRKVYFDLSLIRPKGAMISGGFKAPGPEPLRKALDKVEYLIQGLVLNGVKRLRPIDVYDICMHTSDAVLSGGVRRSACICLFSPEDTEMLNAKTGNWYETNKQRGRSNNSVVLVRSEVTKEQFDIIMKSIEGFGEPGFFMVENRDITGNPCLEIGMFPQIREISGWQGCNLAEINGALANSEEEFLRACKGAAILGTLQAGYTDFSFLSAETKEIYEREALLGCSVTGWMNNPKILFNPELQKKGAELIKAVNKNVAKMIGINPAARTTAVKPAGTTSVFLQTASGIHGEHSARYIRHVQMTKDSEIAQLILEQNPYMVEDSVWSENKTDYCIAFPIVSPKGSYFRENLMGLDLLKLVQQVQQNWIEYGTDEKLCVIPGIRHNVSNTVTVPTGKWKEVGDYLFENKDFFAGVSFLSETGDKDYAQAPFTEVKTENEIVKEYGPAALFAAGLIVDTRKGFDTLWDATTLAKQEQKTGGEVYDLRSDWVRRFRKFADTYFKGDMTKAEYCLKDVFLLHKWAKIQQNFQPVDFVNGIKVKKYTEVDTLGSQACSAGSCDITF